MTCADKSWVEARQCVVQKAREMAAAMIRAEAMVLASELEAIAVSVERVHDPAEAKKRSKAVVSPPATAQPPKDPKEPPFGSPDQGVTPNATAEAQRAARRAREGGEPPPAQTATSAPAADPEPAKGGRTDDEWEEVAQQLWNAIHKADEVDLADIRLRIDIAAEEGLKARRVMLLRDEVAKREKAVTGGLG